MYGLNPLSQWYRGKRACKGYSDRSYALIGLLGCSVVVRKREPCFLPHSREGEVQRQGDLGTPTEAAGEK